MNFASDNTSGVHPRIMAALAAANDGHPPSYGADALTQAAQDRLREVFEAPGAAVHFVATGTAANALALSQFAPPWGKIYCHASAHIQTSESNAPEFLTGGAKLVALPGEDGRIAPATLAQALHENGRDSVNSGVNSVLSLTNATEWGTVYSPLELAELSARAHAAGLAVHLDGSRLANAIAAQNAAPAAMTWRAGVDVLTLGATKCGCMGVEAVVTFDPDRAAGLGYRRKRAGHLLSKHRYLSAQILAWLDGGLWLDLARHANDMAARLGQGLAALEGVRLNAPVQSNGVFATLPREIFARARAAGAAFAVWPVDQFDDGKGPVPVRLICSWDTRADEVDGFLSVLRAG